MNSKSCANSIFAISLLLILPSCGSGSGNESLDSLSLNPHFSPVNLDLDATETFNLPRNLNTVGQQGNGSSPVVEEKLPLDTTSGLIFDVTQFSDDIIMTNAMIGNSEKTVFAAFKRDTGSKYNAIDNTLEDFTSSLDISKVDFQNNSGTVGFGGTTFTVVNAKQDTTTGNFGILIHNPNGLTIDWYDSYAIAGGEPFIPFTSIPSGEITYSGESKRLVSTTWFIGNQTLQYTGTFTMDVNFSAGTADLDIQFLRETSGGGRSTYFEGRGLSVDARTGIFSGTLNWHDISHTNNNSRFDADGKPNIHGSFHGNGGTHVTGAYYEKSDGNVAGYILGSRQQ